jgi:superfamily II DNA or RNA helicase
MTKEKDFEEFITQRNKVVKKTLNEKFLKTYLCPVHNIRIRIGFTCPICDDIELEKGRHASEEARKKKNELYKGEYREKVLQRARVLREMERIRKSGHSIS